MGRPGRPGLLGDPRRRAKVRQEGERGADGHGGPGPDRPRQQGGWVCGQAQLRSSAPAARYRRRQAAPENRHPGRPNVPQHRRRGAGGIPGHHFPAAESPFQGRAALAGVYPPPAHSSTRRSRRYERHEGHQLGAGSAWQGKCGVPATALGRRAGVRFTGFPRTRAAVQGTHDLVRVPDRGHPVVRDNDRGPAPGQVTRNACCNPLGFGSRCTRAWGWASSRISRARIAQTAFLRAIAIRLPFDAGKERSGVRVNPNYGVVGRRADQ